MVRVDMCPEAVLVAEGLVTVWARGFLLLRVTDLEVLLQVGAVTDGFMAYGTRSRLIRVVL